MKKFLIATTLVISLVLNIGLGKAVFNLAEQVRHPSVKFVGWEAHTAIAKDIVAECDKVVSFRYSYGVNNFVCANGVSADIKYNNPVNL